MQHTRYPFYPVLPSVTQCCPVLPSNDLVVSFPRFKELTAGKICNNRLQVELHWDPGALDCWLRPERYTWHQKRRRRMDLSSNWQTHPQISLACTHGPWERDPKGPFRQDFVWVMQIASRISTSPTLSSLSHENDALDLGLIWLVAGRASWYVALTHWDAPHQSSWLPVYIALSS